MCSYMAACVALKRSVNGYLFPTNVSFKMAAIQTFQMSEIQTQVYKEVRNFQESPI